MKYLMLVLSLTLFSTVAMAKRCLNDNHCPILDSEGQLSCFLVETGISPMGQKTCRVQCVPEITGSLCMKKQSRVVGKCVDHRLASPYGWDPDSGCDHALSQRLWNRIHQD